MEKIIEVVAAVIQKDGKFLISKRLKDSPMGHCWEFPGGKLEVGETLEECAVRECEEEIGVLVAPIRLIKDQIFEYPHGKFLLHFMLCHLVSGDPRPIECREVKWIQADEFASYEFPPADREVIESLFGLPD